LGLLWTAIFFYPSIAVIQEICGRIGLLTGSGLAAILGKRYSKRKIVLQVISLLIIANTINIGADIGAMAASVSLIIPQIPLNIFGIFFTILIIITIIRIPY
jgi:Mn2+/Fe2+ NRAMP family transporter